MLLSKNIYKLLVELTRKQTSVSVYNNTFSIILTHTVGNIENCCMRSQPSSQKGRPAQWPTFQQADFLESESHIPSLFLCFFGEEVKGSLRWRGTLANYTADRSITGKQGQSWDWEEKSKLGLYCSKARWNRQGLCLWDPLFTSSLHLQTSAQRAATRGGDGWDVNVNPLSQQADFLRDWNTWLAA